MSQIVRVTDKIRIEPVDKSDVPCGIRSSRRFVMKKTWEEIKRVEKETGKEPMIGDMGRLIRKYWLQVRETCAV